MEKEIQKIEKQLQKIESELENSRTSSFEDGWQTQRHAKKARKWDVLAQEKMALLAKLDVLKTQ